MIHVLSGAAMVAVGAVIWEWVIMPALDAGYEWLRRLVRRKKP